MGASEKFCLRWNDFESNISVAFRELRDEKDFFDVTLACDDASQVQAHKVILSACSPFFRQILRRNPHQHPLLYLKGVKYKELLAVLNFMYQGEVNVAQEELNSFLVVAEDLRVKGLTQNNPDGRSEGSGRGSRSEPGKSGRIREPPDRGDAHPGPPPKRQRSLAPAPPPLLHAGAGRAVAAASNHSFNKKEVASDIAAAGAEEDDDIQEVVPTIVKSEPRESTAVVNESAAAGRVTAEDGVADASEAEFAGGEDDDDDGRVIGGEVALEDSYQDETYDYGGAEYGDVSFGGDDGSGQVIDPATGMPVGPGSSDGNKADCPQLDDIVTQLTSGNAYLVCRKGCGSKFKNPAPLYRHEAVCTFGRDPPMKPIAVFQVKRSRGRGRGRGRGRLAMRRLQLTLSAGSRAEIGLTTTGQTSIDPGRKPRPSLLISPPAIKEEVADSEPAVSPP